MRLNAQTANRILAGETLNSAMLREIVEEIVRDNTRASEIVQRLRRLLKKEVSLRS